MMLKVYLRDECPDPTATLTSYYQKLVSGSLPATIPISGTIWLIKCETGYRWLDGLNIKNLTCSKISWIYQSACLRTAFIKIFSYH